MHKSVWLSLMVWACLCAGCSDIAYYQPPWMHFFSPPAPTYHLAARRRHHHGEHWRLAHNHPPAHESATETASAGSEDESRLPPPAPVLVSNPPVTLSLAGDGMDRKHAEHLLDSVDTKLERAHNHRLSRAETQTYDRASELAGRARHALADDDCAAASSLAAKASSLASGIGGSEL